MHSRICFGALLLFSLFAVVTVAQEQGSPVEPPPTPVAPSTPQGPLRVGGNVMMQSLISQPMPVYPEIGKKAHIAGTVLLHAIIGKDGTVQDLQYISGPPLLMRAAMDAVRQWRYKPTLLNGNSVAVDTTVAVTFTLADAPADSSSPVSQSTAQVSASPSAAELANDPQFQADIRRLMDVTHYRENTGAAMRMLAEPLRLVIIRSIPATSKRDAIADAYVSNIVGLVASDEDISNVTTTYAKYLSDEDIKGLIEFYQTTAGQHFNATKFQLTGDLGREEMELVHAHLAEILRQLCNEYPELQGEANFCKSDVEKKSFLQNTIPFHDGN
jgi:TonB family protein